MQIDEFLPKCHYAETRSRLVKATPHQAYETLQQVDLSKSLLIRFLFWIRGVKAGSFQQLQTRFSILHTDPPREFIWGLIARPWQLDSGPLNLSSNFYKIFDEAGYAKIIWKFSFEPQGLDTLVTIETRVFCTDEKSKEKFEFYWLFARPFSRRVRTEILRLLGKSLKEKHLHNSIH